MAMLRDVSVTRVTMVSDAKCYVLNMAVVSMGSVYVMQALDIKGYSVMYRDVLDGRRIAVAMVHVTLQQSNVHVTQDGLDRHAAGLTVLELQTVTTMESVFPHEVRNPFFKIRITFEKVV
jgi:hypothetical protein